MRLNPHPDKEAEEMEKEARLKPKWALLLGVRKERNRGSGIMTVEECL